MSIAPIHIPSAPAAIPVRTPTPSAAPNGTPFAQSFHQLLNQVTDSHQQANSAVQNFALGNTDNVHQVVLAVTKADLTFRFLLEVRNRITEGLQEILRMQV